MTYYAASGETLLRMGTATASSRAALPAHNTDTYQEVGLVRNIQPPPVEQTAGSFKVLNDKFPRSTGGRQVDQEYTGTVAVDRADVGYALKADAGVVGGQYRNFELEYPDGTIEQFAGFCRRYAMTQLNADEENAPHEAEFAIRVDGEITEV